jgi:hypothetical protein
MQLFVQSEAEYEKFAEVSRVLHLAVTPWTFSPLAVKKLKYSALIVLINGPLYRLPNHAITDLYNYFISWTFLGHSLGISWQYG